MMNLLPSFFGRIDCWDPVLHWPKSGRVRGDGEGSKGEMTVMRLCEMKIAKFFLGSLWRIFFNWQILVLAEWEDVEIKRQEQWFASSLGGCRSVHVRVGHVGIASLQPCDSSFSSPSSSFSSSHLRPLHIFSLPLVNLDRWQKSNTPRERQPDDPSSPMQPSPKCKDD